MYLKTVGLSAVCLLLTIATPSHAEWITGTVPVGSSPVALAANPVTNRIYVANRESGTVTVIDGATNAVTTISCGAAPKAIAVNPVTGRVYVANNGASDATVIEETPQADLSLSAGLAPLAGDTTQANRPKIVGQAGNGLTASPLLGILNRTGTNQRSWQWANLSRFDSLSWAYNWGNDTLVIVENMVCALAMEAGANIGNQGLGTPLTGNLTVYPVYRLPALTAIAESECRRIPNPASIRLRIAPNPVAGSAQITYTIPAATAEPVRLTLHNITGALVRTIYSGHPTGGTHCQRLPVQALPHGVYVLRLTAGSDDITTQFVRR